MADDSSPPTAAPITQESQPVVSVDPSKIPPYAWVIIMMLGGTGLTGINLYGDNDAKTDDIVRIEAKVETLDQKMDVINDKFTDLRILVAELNAKEK